MDAIELVQSNVDIMKSKINDKMNINVQQGNALNLSMYDDNIFDITLVLGPLYHLFKKTEEEKAITEAISLEPGMVITIPANVKHWHGAKKDSWFSHIAVEVPGEDTKNEWCEPVSDEDYDRL